MKTRKTHRYESVKDWREAARLTTRQAAKLLDVSQTKYCRIERGQCTIRGPLLDTVRHITGVPLETLVGAS